LSQFSQSVYGSSTSHSSYKASSSPSSLLQTNGSHLQERFGISSLSGEELTSNFFDLVLNYSQFHSTWSAANDACTAPTMERGKVPITIMVAIDIAFVLAMFLGLLRLCDRDGGMFGLLRLLWNQVRWWQFLVGAVLSIR
jgi:hypothetical protein